MGLIANVNPHARVRACAFVLHGHDGVVGSHHMRLPHPIPHQFIERFSEVSHIAAPDRLRGPRDLEALPCKDVFQPVVREVISKFAGYDVGQQARSGHALVDSCLRLGYGFHAWILAVRLATRTGILFAHMMEALEVAGKILDLPTLVGADLLALNTAARTQALLRIQFVDVGGNGQVVEVGKIAPALAPLHAPQLFGWFRGSGQIVCLHGLVIHLLGEVQQHLRQVVVRLQTVGARTVIPFLESLQFQLRAKKFNL
jgi:hypothetical protein